MPDARCLDGQHKPGGAGGARERAGGEGQAHWLERCVWGQRDSKDDGRPSAPYNWLRGLDLNQRPLGYEPPRGHVDNPLIVRRNAVGTESCTFGLAASWFG